MFQFYQSLGGHRVVVSSVTAQGGVFAHLVGMVADDILAVRTRRHAAVLAAAAARARRMRNFAIFMVVIIALGLLAWYHNFLGMFGPSDVSKGGPPSGSGGSDGGNITTRMDEL